MRKKGREGQREEGREGRKEGKSGIPSGTAKCVEKGSQHSWPLPSAAVAKTSAAPMQRKVSAKSACPIS